MFTTIIDILPLSCLQITKDNADQYYAMTDMTTEELLEEIKALQIVAVKNIVTENLDSNFTIQEEYVNHEGIVTGTIDIGSNISGETNIVIPNTKNRNSPYDTLYLKDANYNILFIDGLMFGIDSELREKIDTYLVQ